MTDAASGKSIWRLTICWACVDGLSSPMFRRPDVVICADNYAVQFDVRDKDHDPEVKLADDAFLCGSCQSRRVLRRR